MKRGIIISAVLHLLIISAVLFSAPFTIQKKPFDFSQVIKINAVAAPETFASSPAPIEDIIIPDAIPDDELFDIPIDDPTSIDKPVVIDKPKPKKKDKPKPKKDKKKNTRKQTNKTKTPPNEAKTGTNKGKEVETTSGSPFAGASVDNASFDYPYWFTLASNKYIRNFRKTVSIQGTVTLKIFFEVIESGKIIKYEIVESSGIANVDRDCLAVFERIGSFPPLPKEFRDGYIGITVTIEY